MIRRLPLLLLVLPLAAGAGLAPAPAPAWSYDVHAIVCELAWQRLTPEARRFVLEVREGDPEPSPTFAESCIWADEVRRTTHRETYEYHFINVDRGSEDVDWERDCGHFACVTLAVVRYARVLAEPAEGRSARIGRAEALKFLGHFVGDLHQPLHAGYRDDRGGNDTGVVWDGEEENLHWVWDGLVPARAGLDERGDGERLAAEIGGAEADRWTSFDVYGWTEESFDITRGFAYDLPPGDLATSAYAERAAAIAVERVKQAGVRLAFLINAIAEGRELEFPPFPAGAESGPRTGAGSLVPVDEAGRDPGLLTFRARLLRALTEGDLEAVVEAAHPEIELSFGGDFGRETFRERLRDPEYRGELAAVLGLGGVFSRENVFVAPYVFGRWPDDYEGIGCYAVIGEDVRVRAAPDLDAEILGLVTYEPVCYRGSEATPREGWTEITLEDGRTGYVAERFLRSPVDHRAILVKRDGRWWIRTFIAGD